MSRETYMEAQIPAGTESPVYLDARQIARAMGRHLPESFIGQVVGAGGAGGSVTNVPFEPALIFISEATGPTLTMTVRGGGLAAAVEVNMISGAVNANVPVVTQAGDNDWTIALPTALAPDADTATVIAFGVRNVGGSL